MPGRTLVTSIPPRLTRPLADGSDHGPAWQARCVSSWQELGFRVISVNPAAELDRVPPLPDVEYRPPRQAGAGGPVRIVELVRAARAEPVDLVGIVNADICLEPSSRRGVAVPSGAVAVAHRVDVTLPTDETGERYRWGLDLVLCARETLPELPDDGFELGRPWWDYWLPLALVAGGLRLENLAGVHALHLRHPTRFSPASWTSFGARFSRWLLTQRGGRLQALTEQAVDRIGADVLADPSDGALEALSELTIDRIDDWGPRRPNLIRRSTTRRRSTSLRGAGR